jgi:hypothetical protein
VATDIDPFGIGKDVGPVIAGAEQALKPGGSPLTGGDTNVTPSLSGWTLEASGLKDWFFRGLMVVGGLFLMGYGVAKLMNAEQILKEIPPVVPV